MIKILKLFLLALGYLLAGTASLSLLLVFGQLLLQRELPDLGSKWV